MNVAEAICRGAAVISGDYDQDVNDDDFRQAVATQPCRYPDPDDADFPLGADWQSKEFLTRPYSWFLNLDEETQIGYLEHLDSASLNYLDNTKGLREAMTKWVVDAELGKPGKSIAAKSVGDKWVSPGRLVLTWPDLDLTARAVLFTMAAHGNDKGENIWISQSSIGDYIGRDRTTVYRAVKRLEKVGAITVTAKARQQKPATYRINRGSRAI